KSTRLAVSCLTLTALMAAPRAALAEGWLMDAEIGLGTGLEGGDPGSGSIEWQRARTRIIAGVELRDDEDEVSGLGIRGFAEIEGRGSVGLDLRYQRWIVPAIGVHAGAIGTVAPETLLGAGVGARLVIPLGRRAGLFVEPAFYALPIGSDLPDDSVLFWALLSGGLRVSL